jgi:hypothetical protein
VSCVQNFCEKTLKGETTLAEWCVGCVQVAQDS